MQEVSGQYECWLRTCLCRVQLPQSVYLLAIFEVICIHAVPNKPPKQRLCQHPSLASWNSPKLSRYSTGELLFLGILLDKCASFKATAPRGPLQAKDVSKAGAQLQSVASRESQEHGTKGRDTRAPKTFKWKRQPSKDLYEGDRSEQEMSCYSFVSESRTNHFCKGSCKSDCGSM